MITYGRWGHIGGSFSLADCCGPLLHAMHVKPDDPHWAERDRLILLKAHASPPCMAMALRGYFPIDALYTYCGRAGCSKGTPTCGARPAWSRPAGRAGMGLSVAAGWRSACGSRGNPGRACSASSAMARRTKETSGSGDERRTLSPRQPDRDRTTTK